MTAYNLAVCFCPNLFRFNQPDLPYDIFYSVMTKMIEKYDQVFEYGAPNSVDSERQIEFESYEYNL